jgi:hypothetical protein
MVGPDWKQEKTSDAGWFGQDSFLTFEISLIISISIDVTTR